MKYKIIKNIHIHNNHTYTHTHSKLEIHFIYWVNQNSSNIEMKIVNLDEI